MIKKEIMIQNVQHSLHAGDIYYNSFVCHQDGWCCIKTRVHSEPKCELDEYGEKVWTFEGEKLEMLCYYKDKYGLFQVYKSIKYEKEIRCCCRDRLYVILPLQHYRPLIKASRCFYV